MLQVQSMDDRARKILRDNDRGGYTIPTEGLYPYQWNWDSAFAAFGFAQFDLDRAWTEIETLFSGQWDNGMLPHIIFHQVDEGYFPGPDVWGANVSPPSSGITQPPVAATFARCIFDKDPDKGRAHLDGLFDKMLAWHRWFHDYRCESGAVAITHPWEAGRDNALDWDEAMSSIDISDVGDYIRRDTGHVDANMRPTKLDYDRFLSILYFGRECGWDEDEIRTNGPFRVADPTMTFTLLRANRDLLALAVALGRNTAEIEGWITGLEQGARALWNPDIDAYDARNLRTGHFSGSLSNASFLCWYAGLDSEAMLAHLQRILDQVAFGVPSLDPQNPEFDPKRYWRGPVWGVMNTMIGIGLKEAGHTEAAEILRKNTAKIIETGGFAEYFNPLDGSAAGGSNFTWTAAIWLGWASPNAKGQG